MTKVNHTLPVAHQWLSLILYGGIILQVRNIHTSMLTVFGLFGFFASWAYIISGYLFVILLLYLPISYPIRYGSSCSIEIEINNIMNLTCKIVHNFCLCVCVVDQMCSNAHSCGFTLQIAFSFALSCSLLVGFVLIGINRSLKMSHDSCFCWLNILWA